MRKLLLMVTASLFSLSLLSTANAETVHFTTEEYPPFNYRDGKTAVGATVEQVQKVMADIGVDYTIDVLPWARAYNQALTEPLTCVFVTAHNDERDKRLVALVESAERPRKHPISAHRVDRARKIEHRRPER